MSAHYILITNISLNNFNVSIYKYDDYVGEIIDNETINSSLNLLNSQETAIELAQAISEFIGVAKIKIYNKSDVLLLDIELLLE
jgi:hypothetical protein